MDNLKNNRALVKRILEEDKRCRNSDSFLYFKVLEAYSGKHGVDLGGMSVKTFLLRQQELGFPPFETVRRNRQLVQQRFPALAADDPIDAFRLANEERVKDYVRGARYEQ